MEEVPGSAISFSPAFDVVVERTPSCPETGFGGPFGP